MFTRRRLLRFLWYELPRKWLIGREEHIAVADALGLFFDELGPQAGELAALCRSPETARLLRDGGEGFSSTASTQPRWTFVDARWTLKRSSHVQAGNGSTR